MGRNTTQKVKPGKRKTSHQRSEQLSPPNNEEQGSHTSSLLEDWLGGGGREEAANWGNHREDGRRAHTSRDLFFVRCDSCMKQCFANSRTLMELQEKITKVSSEPLAGDSVLLPGVKISSERYHQRGGKCQTAGVSHFKGDI